MSGLQLGGEWDVVSYLSGGEMITPATGADRAHLVIDDRTIAGTMGVNRFTGGFDGRRVVGPLASTRMAGPPHLMRQEDELLRHLQEADSFEVDGEGMTLSRDGLTSVELRRSGTIHPRSAS